MSDLPSYSLNSDVVFTRFDDTSGALLHLKTKRYYTLNETGTRIWELFEKGPSVGELAAAVEGEYEVESDAATQHVIEFLEELAQEGLVDRSTAGSK
jgi:hypothetical protein